MKKKIFVALHCFFFLHGKTDPQASAQISKEPHRPQIHFFVKGTLDERPQWNGA